jgi:hypothetical protein
MKMLEYTSPKIGVFHNDKGVVLPEVVFGV